MITAKFGRLTHSLHALKCLSVLSDITSRDPKEGKIGALGGDMAELLWVIDREPQQNRGVSKEHLIRLKVLLEGLLPECEKLKLIRTEESGFDLLGRCACGLEYKERSSPQPICVPRNDGQAR